MPYNKVAYEALIPPPPPIFKLYLLVSLMLYLKHSRPFDRLQFVLKLMVGKGGFCAPLGTLGETTHILNSVNFLPTCFAIRGKMLSRNTKLNHNKNYKMFDLEKHSYIVQNFIARCRKNFFSF